MVNVILLNGASSSGKTTIANLLQSHLGEKSIIESIDTFLENLPGISQIKTKGELRNLVYKAIPEFHRKIFKQAGLGKLVVVDHVLQESEWLKDFHLAGEGLAIKYVGVKCPLPVLERREKERGDREIGLAKKQAMKIHHGIAYDVEVDTSILRPEECVDEILAAFEGLKSL